MIFTLNFNTKVLLGVKEPKKWKQSTLLKSHGYLYLIVKKHEAEQANSTINISFILSFDSAGLHQCICALNSHISTLVKENTIIPVESIKRVSISHFKVIAFWKFTKDATCSKVLKNTEIIKKKILNKIVNKIEEFYL